MGLGILIFHFPGLSWDSVNICEPLFQVQVLKISSMYSSWHSHTLMYANSSKTFICGKSLMTARLYLTLYHSTWLTYTHTHAPLLPFGLCSSWNQMPTTYNNDANHNDLITKSCQFYFFMYFNLSTSLLMDNINIFFTDFPSSFWSLSKIFSNNSNSNPFKIQIWSCSFLLKTTSLVP